MSNKIKVVDLCCGVGGLRLGFEKYEEFETVFSNDMDKHCKVTYDLNFESSKMTLKDIHDIDPKDIPQFDLLLAGYPCFVAGTRVATANGYIPIENVTLNDTLLTHTGKFQKILNLQKKLYTGWLYELNVKYHPENIVCTEEHPFYVKEKTRSWNNKIQEYNYSFKDPQWIKAKDLGRNHYLGMIINTKSIIPHFIFRNEIISLDDPNIWFMMGYFVSGGCSIDSKYYKKVSSILPIADQKYGVVWFNILKQFGRYAHGKKIPEWVQNAPVYLIKEFIRGYIKADGCVLKNDMLQITTVSYNLAFGLQRLYLKLGQVFSVNKQKRPKTPVIKGRRVNQRDIYQVRGKLRKEQIHGFIEDGYAWFPIKDILTKETIRTPVYNFEVNCDNSYIVENVIVHNCQPFSIAGKRLGFSDKRSNVFYAIIKVIKEHKPKCIFLENVKNLERHKRGETFKIMLGLLLDLGYHIKYKVLNTKDYTQIPHNRERIFIVGFLDKKVFNIFNFPASTNKPLLHYKEFLEPEVDQKYIYNTKPIYDKIKDDVNTENHIYQYRRYYIRSNKNGICPTLTANMGTGGHNVPLIYIKSNNVIRKLTPRECFNFQGFPDTFKLPKLADCHLYKQAGNSVTVPLIEILAGKILEALIS